jgi:hypothetical protein
MQMVGVVMDAPPNCRRDQIDSPEKHLEWIPQPAGANDCAMRQLVSEESKAHQAVSNDQSE